MHAGIDWLLSKLHANLSVILGDEMGLGKVGRRAGAAVGRGM